MADQATTGAVKEVTVIPADDKEKMKKLVIKVAIITLVILVTIWLYNKFIR